MPFEFPIISGSGHDHCSQYLSRVVSIALKHNFLAAFPISANSPFCSILYWLFSQPTLWAWGVVLYLSVFSNNF